MEMNIKTFVERFKRGDFNYSSRRIQCEAGWYDWFCNDSALANKTKKLGAKVCKIANSKRFNKETSYVFFKNNCPCVGALYDQFSICDIESCDVLFCAQHLEKGSHGCDKAHWELYDADISFEKPIVSGTWREVEKYFNN